jgi:hypothetical protein
MGHLVLNIRGGAWGCPQHLFPFANRAAVLLSATRAPTPAVLVAPMTPTSAGTAAL